MDNQTPTSDKPDPQNSGIDPGSLPQIDEGVLGDSGTSMPQLAQGADDSAAPQISVQLPDEAADTDIIEKEWVERAKQIVDQTGSDPYVQQQEIGKVKADYLKKRYNKDIKLSD